MTPNWCKEAFDYRNGELFWRIVRGRGKIGKVAGCLSKHGYWVIRYDRKLYYRSRLVWFWHHGCWPKKEIDHWNGDRADDRVENLRAVTISENQYNRGKQRNNTTGYKGVSYRKGKLKPWEAYIAVGGKNRLLGTFATVEEAHEAYLKAADDIQGEFAHHRRR